VIWQFLGHDPPINCRRTLDQFGYPSLLDTRARDDDQMLYKMTKQRFAHHDDIFTGTEEKKRMAEIRRIEQEEDNSSDSSDSSIDVSIGCFFDCLCLDDWTFFEGNKSNTILA